MHPSAVRFTLSAAMLALAATPRAPQAQEPAPARTGTMSGVVYNLNGIPIPRVEVLIIGTDLRSVTSDSGVYEFLLVPIGRYKVIARRIGFEPEEQRATIDGARNRQVDFEMKGLPEQLDSVMVREAGGRGRMSDFWARRMVGVGAFITRTDIEKRHPQKPSDLLRTVTGVKVSLGDDTFDRARISMGRNQQSVGARPTAVGRIGGVCEVTYYVDGSYVPSGTFHMDDMSPTMVEAVEVYRGPSETPARFRQRDTACGVISIWTREPPARQGKPPGGQG